MIERECCFRPPSHCSRDDRAFCVDSIRRLVQLVLPALAGQREVTLLDMAALHIIARSVSEERRKLIEEAPTIDAVPVVRCKDCKSVYDGAYDFCCTRHVGLVKITPNSFCSYGERKDDAENH